MRTLWRSALVLVLWTSLSSAQTNSELVLRTNSIPSQTQQGTNAWSFSLSAYGYLVPDSRDYVQPTLTADHNWLHLEARYNYEALDTGSLWLGYNLGGGSNLTWTFTPMLGGVFGDTTGIAPGYSGSLNWWKLGLYSEGEYVVAPGSPSRNFFYNWSELTIAPLDWLSVGMVTQRTRAYHTDRDIQRGFLVRLSYKELSFTSYVFNPDESKPTLVLAIAVNF